MDAGWINYEFVLTFAIQPQSWETGLELVDEWVGGMDGR